MKRPAFLSFWVALVVMLGAQFALWDHSRNIKPQMEVVPAVPGQLAVKALSFGDNEFFFRLLGIHLQNFGDTFGRFTALRDYNFERLNGWFNLLDSLNNKSDYIPTMASYYFSQTQNTPDVIHVIDYLRKHSQHRVNEKWWWQAQAVYLANHKLENTELALELAKPLVNAKDVPLWVNQLPAFIYEKRGEYGAALGIMETIMQNTDDIKQGEMNFIRHFIDERLAALENATRDMQSNSVE